MDPNPHSGLASVLGLSPCCVANANLISIMVSLSNQSNNRFCNQLLIYALHTRPSTPFTVPFTYR